MRVQMPRSYVEWRESQGFQGEQIPLLYLQIDSKNESELRTYLESSLKSNLDSLYDINHGVECLNKATEEIIRRGNKKLLNFTILVCSTKNDFIDVTQYACLGHYQTSMVVLRSSFEGLLRIIFNAFKAHEDAFSKMLSDENMPSMITREGLNWLDALKVEKALSAYQMCAILNKIGFTKPLKNPYEFLGIGELNAHTHRNIDKIATSASFMLNHKYGESNKVFDIDRLRVILDYYQKYVEFLLIVLQNAADIMQPIADPLLIPDSKIKDNHPKYHELAVQRFHPSGHDGSQIV